MRSRNGDLNLWSALRHEQRFCGKRCCKKRVSESWRHKEANKLRHYQHKEETKGQETWIVSWLSKGATDYSFDDVHAGCTGNQKKNDDIKRSRKWRSQNDKVAKEKGLEYAEDEFIECIIYHRMWDSEACWNTITDFTTGLRRIKTKSGKFASLKDNIRFFWKGLGWE